jgi:hypothetical protein
VIGFARVQGYVFPIRITRLLLDLDDTPASPLTEDIEAR